MGGTHSTYFDGTQQAVDYSHFANVRVVGKGSFGKVRMVEHRKTHVLYAMKCISKRRCVRLQAVHNILREREILEQIDHPLICNMRYAFQDRAYVYMAMDLMMGGDLRFHLSRARIPEHVARFWMAELACAVRYLHTQGFVHRDIKPDNVLLDQDGHVHLSDFNIACALPRKRVLTSQSGSAAYFAPEVFKGTGYTEDVDWWGLGMVFYECVYGKRPWGPCASQAELQKLVCRRNTITYPQPDDGGEPISSTCISAIRGFLDHEPKKRLGHGSSGWQALLNHPFFHGIDWVALDSKEVEPPFRPATDQQNFEAIHDLEENILGPQDVFNDSSSYGQNDHAQQQGMIDWLLPKTSETPLVEGMAPDRYERLLRQLEERFRPFDYMVYETYQGFDDPQRLTVGPPPDWVKPAFQGADQDLLPIKHVSLQHEAQDSSHHDASEAQLSPPSPLRMSWHTADSHATHTTNSSKRGSNASELMAKLDSPTVADDNRASRRSSAQSFLERRERDRRRSSARLTGDVIATTE